VNTLGLADHPSSSTRYVVLEVLSNGIRIFSNWTSTCNVDNVVRLRSGALAYKIIGFADNAAQAQRAIGMHSCACNDF